MNKSFKFFLYLTAIVTILTFTKVSIDFHNGYAYIGFTAWLESFIAAHEPTFKMVTILGIPLGIWFSIARINQQDKIIKLQTSNLDEVIKNNTLLKYKNHVDHYRKNVEYIKEIFNEKITINHPSLLAYHRIYHSFKTGSFDVNKSTIHSLEEYIIRLIELTNGFTYKNKLRNTVEPRVVDICDCASDMIGCFGITYKSKYDIIEGTDVILGNVYEHVSDCFKVLVTLLDGDIGPWSDLSMSIAYLDADDFEGQRVNFSDEYDPENLSALLAITSKYLKMNQVMLGEK
ncbi:hypothetical protein NMD15_12910 [Plesiomonas shigelloides]|uniref:hypothetical protein n=1 Tax=Plesiomonas shigelloides TaxID=703 RepID=UPI00351D5B8F